MRAFLFRALLAGSAFLPVWPSSAGAEEVNLSRYTLTVAATSPAIYAPVDSGVLDAFCGDDDGCAVTLKAEGPTVMIVQTERLFVTRDNSLRWTKQSYVGVPRLDADGNSDIVVNPNAAGNACAFTDGENPIDGGDSAKGFVVVALSTGTMTCFLVLVD